MLPPGVPFHTESAQLLWQQDATAAQIPQIPRSEQKMETARRMLRFALAATLAAGLGVTVLCAQTGTSFTLQGTVFDPSGAVVPGATVSVKNLSLGLARTGQADDQGHYVFAALPPTGEYQISVESPGFASQTRRGLTFEANASPVINFTLKPGAVQEN